MPAEPFASQKKREPQDHQNAHTQQSQKRRERLFNLFRRRDRSLCAFAGNGDCGRCCCKLERFFGIAFIRAYKRRREAVSRRRRIDRFDFTGGDMNGSFPADR